MDLRGRRQRTGEQVGRVYEEKEIRTEAKEEFKATNLNPFVMFPIALFDLALLGEVVRRRIEGY